MLKKIKIGKFDFKINSQGNSPAYYCKKKNNICINKNIINKLLKIFKKNKKTFRICLHGSNKEKIHCMIVVVGKKDKTEVHKHLLKTEYYYIHYGKIDLLTFESKKKKYTKYSMNSNSSFLFKMIQKKYHQVVPRSNVVIYSEIRNGPFKKNDSIVHNK